MRTVMWEGIPQGGVLSPLLWAILVKKAVGGKPRMRRRSNDCSTRQSCLYSFRKNPNCTQWCKDEKLSVNPNKKVVVPFTRQRVHTGMKPLLVNRQEITFSKRVKYQSLIIQRWSYMPDDTNNQKHVSPGYHACSFLLHVFCGNYSSAIY